MFGERDGELCAMSEALQISFDRLTGAVGRVENRVTGQVLVEGGTGVPWRLLPQGTSWVFMDAAFPEHYRPEQILPGAFSWEAGADALTLRWETSEAGVRVVVVVREGSSASLELWPRVEVEAGAAPPLLLSYPVLAAPRELSPGAAEDYLLFPSHTGVLIRSPLAEGPVEACYPDGYSGCSTQFMAYFEQGEGGLYLGTHDPHSTWKEFCFSAEEWCVRHEAWDLRKGTSMDFDYPVVLASMSKGDWYEAAEVYRSWALANAPWCRALAEEGARSEKGIVERDKCRWLFEDVGLSVWGAPSSLDWSPWYRFYANVAKTPLHIASGWDWPAKRPNTLGKEGWLPANFHPSNLEAWSGHYVTPYMNDLFISSAAEEFLSRWEPTLMFPYVDFTWSRFTGRTMLDAPMLIEQDPRVTTNVDFFPCPAAERFQELHAWRDAGLMETEQVSGVCYDISSGNPMLWSRCWRVEHGHAPGRGREIVEAYDEQNRRSKREARERTGRYLVQGVETIIENVIDSVDFYVARAGSGPLGVLEAWRPRPETPPGKGREIVPLFDAVYHDVGPVREDGWLTLATDVGDLFYWAAARIVVQWGALFSLHYANNPPERLAGENGAHPAEVIDWDGSRVRFAELPELDEDKAAFVAELARARTRLATAYLAYGRLLRPVPPRNLASLELDFRGHIHTAPRLDISGSWDVPQIVHGAWQSPEGNVGLVYVNLGKEATTTTLQANLRDLWSCDPAGWKVRVTHKEASRDAGSVSGEGDLSLELALPGREVVLVELCREDRLEDVE